MQKKATGPDKIPPRIVRLSANIIDSHLANITNSDLLKDSFSEDAKTASSICKTYFQKEVTR